MRLDVFLAENNYFNSRNKATEAIERSEVFVNGKAVLKASKEINPQTDVVEIKQPDKNAQLVAENIAAQLKNRVSFQRMDGMYFSLCESC